jgi:predicted amidohydrolase
LTGYLPKRGEPISIRPDGPIVERIQAEAVRTGLEVYTGASLAVEGKLINAYLKIDQDLDWVAKTHLGRREEEFFQRGNEIRLFQSQAGPVGTAICLESHFPGIFTKCRELGAVMMILPFASPAVCGPREKIWSKILPARAYDNGIYVLATNLCGSDGDRAFSGGMMAVDPKGEIIAQYEGHEDHMMVVDLDLDYVETLRKTNGKTNYFSRRRPELY